MKVVVRADASSWIGTGHVVRCATLAERLRQQGVDVLFVCRRMPGDCCDWLISRGFRVLQLGAVDHPYSGATSTHASWLGVPIDEEIDEITALLSAGGDRFDWLIVDHYAIGAQWESALRRVADKILVIDDLADRKHDCEVLLDQNLSSAGDARYAELVPVGSKLLCGPRYALLQPEYALWRSRVNVRSGTPKRLLVFFGGADVDNMTVQALDGIERAMLTDIVIDVVIGASNHHRVEIETRASDFPRLQTHIGLPSLAPLMAAADLAIGAAGTTSWERCCLGVPSIVIALAANQELIARELDQRGLVRWIGNVGGVDTDLIARALQDFASVGGSPECSRRCMDLVDGNGAGRVLEVLVQ